jgi:addiction module HigA family antidote
MEKLPNIHPGEILKEEFLIPLNISNSKISNDTGIDEQIISNIIKGNFRVDADTALRLSSYFSTTPKFWLGLQDDYDIEKEREAKVDIYKQIKVIQS